MQHFINNFDANTDITEARTRLAECIDIINRKNRLLNDAHADITECVAKNYDRIRIVVDVIIIEILNTIAEYQTYVAQLRALLD